MAIAKLRYKGITKLVELRKNTYKELVSAVEDLFKTSGDVSFKWGLPLTCFCITSLCCHYSRRKHRFGRRSTAYSA